MKETIKDILIRALKTFWQAALAFAIVNSEILFTNVTEFDIEKLRKLGISVGVGAIAAGLSAMYNGVIKPLAGKLKDDIDDIKEE